MSAPEPLSAEQEREIVAQWHRDNPPPPGPPDPPRKVCLDCGAVESWNFITQRLNAHNGRDGARCPGRYRRPERPQSEEERLREQVVHLAGRLGEAHRERDAALAEAERLRAENDRLLDRVWRLRNAVSVGALVARFPSHAAPLHEALEVDGNLAALAPPEPSGGEA